MKLDDRYEIGVETVVKTRYYCLADGRKWEKVVNAPKEAIRMRDLRRWELLTFANEGTSNSL